MTTDNKTLADVQPGGRVRLGDSRSTRAATFLRQYLTYLRSSPRQGLRPRWCDVYEALEIAIEALSAQPSPGGQGDALLESLVARWRNHAEEIGVSDNLLCQKIANCTMRHAAELQAVIAARQPVGEPVGVVTRGTKRAYIAWDDEDSIPDGARVYLAPPAQAVDLALPIAMIDRALGHLSTTLDDLQSSPDRRPAVMVAEAIGYLHQALMGIPHG